MELSLELRYKVYSHVIGEDIDVSVLFWDQADESTGSIRVKGIKKFESGVSNKKHYDLLNFLCTSKQVNSELSYIIFSNNRMDIKRNWYLDEMTTPGIKRYPIATMQYRLVAASTLATIHPSACQLLKRMKFTVSRLNAASFTWWCVKGMIELERIFPAMKNVEILESSAGMAVRLADIWEYVRTNGSSTLPDAEEMDFIPTPQQLDNEFDKVVRRIWPARWIGEVAAHIS